MKLYCVCSRGAFELHHSLVWVKLFAKYILILCKSSWSMKWGVFGFFTLLVLHITWQHTLNANTFV